MQGFFNGVIRIPARTVHMGNSMTTSAGNTGLGSRMVNIIKIRIIKRSGKERHQIVATCTEPCCLHIAIPLKRKFAGVSHREQISRIIERRNFVHAVRPFLMHVLMAFRTVLIHHHGLGRNKIPSRSSCQRWEKVLLTAFRTFFIPGAWILRLPNEHDRGKTYRQCCNAATKTPVNTWPGKTMQNKQPGNCQRCNNVRPVGNITGLRLLDFNKGNAAG